VTADHVNPERPWPDIDRLRDVTEADGFTLAPRLTIYPERVLDPERWVDPALRFAVMDRSDAEGLGRDDPGAFFPERTMENRDAGSGADVMLIGNRTTTWFSGADADVPVIITVWLRLFGAARWPRCSRESGAARSSAPQRSSRCSLPADPRFGRRRHG